MSALRRDLSSRAVARAASSPADERPQETGRRDKLTQGPNPTLAVRPAAHEALAYMLMMLGGGLAAPRRRDESDEVDMDVGNDDEARLGGAFGTVSYVSVVPLAMSHLSGASG